MTLPGKIKGLTNRWLESLNVRIESRTADRTEVARLLSLEKVGQFGQPIFPILSQFLDCDPVPLLNGVESFNDSFKRFSAEDTNIGYSNANDYFKSPDAEVAYTIVRTRNPRRLIEVGSGNSTQLFREAIEDGKLSTELVSIDPSPRKSVEVFAHRVIKECLEEVPVSYFCEALDCNDILFVDSSHQVKIGNDVVRLLLNIVPALNEGVLIHFHDIFLPYEYPRQWVIDYRWDWNEQYLVQALLQGSNQFEVLWPGHFLQRTLPDFADHFHLKPQGTASSLWLRKIA
jgi:hypothetical protein